MVFKQQLTKTLLKKLPDAEIHLKTRSDGRVGGYVVSKKFSRKTQIQRQDFLWRYLEKELSKPQQHKIVAILTMTPAEVEE